MSFQIKGYKDSKCVKVGQNFQNYDVFFRGAGGVIEITIYFDMGDRGRGQKTRKKFCRLLWTAPNL